MTTAREQLTLALVQLAADGRRPPCGDYGAHDVWLSDDPDIRALAADWCTGCPVREQCHNAAEAGDEKFGVWAGIDRTPPKRRPGRPAQTTTIKET
ncbi:hypothetical protein MLP_30480 [Microlunatus phosphovorus NM-1]|uniref:4Fe-4S Wbl-type domain-containing protein n=1 Tax=Microlunatus phosphovorus (strain ATCC 700054 / DSM 10555 / JCM 9379 / NBRC 101784 / NCIMB 13414 / VKM Ac-1990 / NM-1) TaxID=1032480 RepID=F5XKJ0_MICPN|nr:WhiB family transcriptional regulator [Microlunatus phosphovorus]BAK36062.1 hypothetical protein MLP_30480 [Microlunatus phosphovorus NM-1]